MKRTLRLKFKKNSKPLTESAKIEKMMRTSKKDVEIDNSDEKKIEQEKTAKEYELEALESLTPSQIKALKFKYSSDKRYIDSIKDITYNERIERNNEKLKNIPLHFDLEGE